MNDFGRLAGTFGDPLRWAYFPTSQSAIDVIFDEARHGGVFARIRDSHITAGVCDDDGRALKVWSFAAQKFVRPAWYQRANSERAAA